jgi:hypothetical protein
MTAIIFNMVSPKHSQYNPKQRAAFIYEENFKIEEGAKGVSW